MVKPVNYRIQNEANKFVELNSTDSAVRVVGLGKLLKDVDFDSIEASYPDTVTEVYVYKLASVTQATVTVIYVDATKEKLVSVVKS